MATVQQTAGSDWKSGLFGCFADARLCLLTYLLPCYTVGKNAEGVGENCLLHGLLALLGLNFGPVIRWRLRQERGIEGSMLMDVLAHMMCPWCAMVQEAREIGWSVPEQLDTVGRTGTDVKVDTSTGGGDGQEIARQ